jgi:hypothetical protein
MGFRALRAARTPGISTFLYMHGPSLSGQWYPDRSAAATADPDDSPRSCSTNNLCRLLGGRMMGFLDVLNWRDVASVSCACWAGVLGDQAVNAVGQNSGLTARNQSHGEVTAIDQSPDRTRGDRPSPPSNSFNVRGFFTDSGVRF